MGIWGWTALNPTTSAAERAHGESHLVLSGLETAALAGGWCLEFGRTNCLVAETTVLKGVLTGPN